MNTLLLSLAFFITSAIDIVVAGAVLSSKEKSNIHLAIALIAGAMVSIFYLLSTLSQDYQTMSILSSCYFISVDVALLAFSMFISMLTKLYSERISGILRKVAFAYLIIDAIGLLLNPFLGEFAISYIPVKASAGLYSYVVHPFYAMHLVYCYLMVAYCLLFLFAKTIKVPGIYRHRYLLYLGGFLFIVALNALYLFLPGHEMYDISILFYSFFGLYVYFMHFHYLKRIVLNQARDLIMEQIGQGIVLFDYEGHLSMINEQAEFLVPENKRNDRLTLDNFLDIWGVRHYIRDMNHDTSFLWNGIHNNRRISCQVNYRLIKDKKGTSLGTLFVLVDNSLEIDILTGFTTQVSSMRSIRAGQIPITAPCVIAVCDIERLAQVNEMYGRATGDDAIILLARIMRGVFPENTKFVRHQDATLLAIANSMSEQEGHACLDEIARRIHNQTSCPAQLAVQCCLEVIVDSNQSLVDAIRHAMAGLRARKLLAESSSHSSLISSLAQMQRQGDGETEEHVQRTRTTGEQLGRRLGLSDAQLNDFALLCLLHDIGKVGVPLEVLNKPGRLTDTEWIVMRSHTTKGYNIAKASEELSGIADYILHHHENWDGSGYPDGLSQEAIPLLSRMVSVVDTFDAMTHHRPYRRAIPLEEAKDELRRCAGTQFDPTIVAEFLAMLEEHPELATSEWTPDDTSIGFAIHTSAPQTESEGETNHEAAQDGETCKHEGDDSEGTPKASSSKEGESCEDHTSPSQRQYARYILDESQRIVEINEEFTRLTGYTTEDLETYNLTQIDLIPHDDQQKYWSKVKIGLERDHAVMIEHRLLTKSGINLFVMCYGREYYDATNKAMRYEIIAADLHQTAMSEWLLKEEKAKAERAQQQWKDILRKDITGVLTRAAFRSDAQIMLMDEKKSIVLLVLDVDYFKQYNDTKGHPSGDALLNRLAQLLLLSCEDDEFAGRFGGDEFAILKVFDAGTPADTIEAVVKSTWEQINQGLIAYDEVHVSLGAARLTNGDIAFSELYAAADDALYKAKENGRGCYYASL